MITSQKKIWKLSPPPSPSEVRPLCESLRVDTGLCQLLVQRGIKTFDAAKSFFNPDLRLLHDPFLMQDMEAAVVRLEQALLKQEKVLIFGDYDVDGTTAVSLMAAFLGPLDLDFETYIPDRYKEGYGLSKAGIDYAHAQGMKLVIALDCGIKAVDLVAYANDLGLDLIICDHHNPGPSIPDALAVLDPKRADCSYPYKELSGCGVGFKLCQALCQRLELSEEQWMPLLDLLAVSIAADIVPITGENRILAHAGIQLINANPRPGLLALIHSSGKQIGRLNITDLVFGLAPRINAAGRMEHGKKAVEILCCSSYEQAQGLASNININNEDRRATDSKITEEALEQIRTKGWEDRSSTVVYQSDWHKGVIGIVASRLIENYYRPTVVFTKSGDKLAASARSVQGFDLYQALECCEDLLLQFGGHKYAAGMTMKEEQLDAFREKFETVVESQILPEQKQPQIDIDQVLKPEIIQERWLNIVQRMEPFGPGNLQPTFASTCLEVDGMARTIGADKNHLKLKIKAGKERFDCIGFGLGPWADKINQDRKFQACYHVEYNHWNGRKNIQLRLLDIKEIGADWQNL